MTRATASLTLPLALALGVVAEWASLRRAPLELPASTADVHLALADFAAGAALVVSAWSLAGRKPGDRVARLLLAAGVLWFLGTFATSGSVAYADLGAAFVTLHRGPIVHALLSAPVGRLESTFDRSVVAAVYVVSAVPSVAKIGVALALTAAAVAIAAARRLARASGTGKAALLVPTAGSAALAAVLAGSAFITFADRTVLWSYDIVVVAVAASLATDVRLGTWTRSTVTRLVVDLGGGAGLRDRLAHTLGDQSLQVGYLVPERDEYVDESGAVLSVDSAARSRTVTTLTQGGGEIGVLVHDAPVVDRELLAGVASAAGIAIANVRLQAEVRRQVGELRASRRRLLDAGDAQRRRIEHAIRRGPERALAQGADLLDAVARPESARVVAALADVQAELQQARRELAEFGRGLHPPSLREGGLGVALRELTRYAPLPVEVDVPQVRLPPRVEETAYFVAAEALANAGKHARARTVTIRARTTSRTLNLAVEDDGVGGADASGPGLRGLADRVETIGGRFDVTSPAGRGTRIVASIPLDVEPQR